MVGGSGCGGSTEGGSDCDCKEEEGSDDTDAYECEGIELRDDVNRGEEEGEDRTQEGVWSAGIGKGRAKVC